MTLKSPNLTEQMEQYRRMAVAPSKHVYELNRIASNYLTQSAENPPYCWLSISDKILNLSYSFQCSFQCSFQWPFAGHRTSLITRSRSLVSKTHPRPSANFRNLRAGKVTLVITFVVEVWCLRRSADKIQLHQLYQLCSLTGLTLLPHPEEHRQSSSTFGVGSTQQPRIRHSATLIHCDAITWSWVLLHIISSQESNIIVARSLSSFRVTIVIFHSYPLVIKHGNGQSPMDRGLNRKITYKWSIFHCHVWLPEGMLCY